MLHPALALLFLEFQARGFVRELAADAGRAQRLLDNAEASFIVTINEALERSAKVVVLWSRNSVGSAWVQAAAPRDSKATAANSDGVRMDMRFPPAV